MDSIHIVVIEDRDVVRMGPQTAIEAMPNCRLVGAYATIVELNRCLQRDTPHILILDDTLPGIDTHNFIRHLKHEYPALKIIVFGSHLTVARICELLEAKADGFVYKGEEDLLHVLPQAISFATRGELFLSPQLSKGFVAYTTTNKPIELSDRLKQVLLLTVRGFAVKEISQTLGVSDKAVYNARDRLKELLNADTTAGIINRAILLKLIDPKEGKEE